MLVKSNETDELIEELETELVKCELMKGQTFEGVYKETLERPGEV